jgi:hypothetical protein
MLSSKTLSRIDSGDKFRLNIKIYIYKLKYKIKEGISSKDARPN